MFIRNTKKLNKRGFTLIELTMVMAIAAIISVMIVTLTSLISAQVNKNDLRADFMEDVLNLRTELQIEFAEIDDGSPISITDNVVKIDDSTLSFDRESYKYIDEITFDVHGNILKVFARNSTLNEIQSFVLISKVG